MYEKNCHNNTIEYPQNKIRLSIQPIINEDLPGIPPIEKGYIHSQSSAPLPQAVEFSARLCFPTNYPVVISFKPGY
jgi:hypothetical protein